MDGELLFEHTETVSTDAMPLYVLGHEWTGGDATELVLSNLTVREEISSASVAPNTQSRRKAAIVPVSN